jgi:hypothetical protein
MFNYQNKNCQIENNRWIAIFVIARNTLSEKKSEKLMFQFKVQSSGKGPLWHTTK